MIRNEIDKMPYVLCSIAYENIAYLVIYLCYYEFIPHRKNYFICHGVLLTQQVIAWNQMYET